MESPDDLVRILVVDDHEENLVAMRGILEEPGYVVVTARSGNEALKQVLKHDFAVILLDVLMPLMDGFETARLIRTRDASRHTPIIFLTAAGSDLAMIERGYAAGAVDYLVKPLHAPMVRAKVAVFAELQRKARQMRRQEELLRAAERDRSEAVIREGEALYEASFNAAAVGIAHVTPDGQWLRANPRFGRTIGYGLDELRTLRMEDVVHPVDLADDRAGLRRLFSGEIDTFHREERYIHKDGHVVWVDLTISPLRDAAGKVKNLIFIVEDISGRHDAKKRERLLAGVSQLLLQSLDHPADMNGVARLIVGLLGEWCVIGTLDARERPTGRPSVAHAEARMADRAERLREALAASPEYAAGLASPSTMTSVGPTADLRVAWNIDPALIGELGVNAALSLPLATHDRVHGRVTFLSADAFSPGEVLSAHDVTQRIALALDNARLHQEAQDAVRARDEFLSIASHELRTPLTPLRIHFQRLLADRGQSGATRGDRVQLALQRCERQVRRLEGLIDNLLDVSRIATAPLNLQLGEVDLGEIVRGVLSRLADELAAAGCRTAVDLGRPLIGCWDRLRLEQVVTNIVVNAIKYAPGSVIEIGIEPAGAGGSASARLTIRDHGAGIPAEDLDRIFQRFHRVVSAPSYGGLGLGLYMVKQIVDAHGGAISVDSESGVGTRFVVELPLAGAGDVRAISAADSQKIPLPNAPAPAATLIGLRGPGVWS